MEPSLNAAEKRGRRWGVSSIITPLLGGVLFYQLVQMFPVRDKGDDSFSPALGPLLFLASTIAGLVFAFVSSARHERSRAISVVGLLMNGLALSYFLLAPLYYISISENKVLAISLVVSLCGHIFIPRFLLACLMTLVSSPWVYALELCTRPAPERAEISWLPFLFGSGAYAFGIAVVVGCHFIYSDVGEERAQNGILSKHGLL